ncbi:hypothetical protein SNE25_09085 [Mucilaginibacter sabulilitoris]|uniref:Uncharacterized protein n=1 Tax=Mucilaginibacter sabulilitoris TaxID=1173583 RepID=A0ABZ0TRB3_9SPHI|nr:hypothetical protein [Mucilaginibacter sabulilitoris]WPU95670.1 hypothetical protein SNE25_09085 [Mucilaginibacter sabulilitoris]
MKKYIYSVLAVIVLLAACKKENSNKSSNPSGKLNHVTSMLVLLINWSF